MDLSLLNARISDAVVSASSGAEKYLGFLGISGASEALKAAEKAGVECRLFGGYDGAERTYAAFLPEWMDPSDAKFPISAVTFSFRECDSLSHRDFLGTLMGLGIERDTVGDILIEKGRAVVFVSNSILKFVLSECDRVGRVGVKLSEGAEFPFPGKGSFEEMSVTVASDRIDAVVAAICKCSRANSVSLISDGNVFINGIEVMKTTVSVKEKSNITVRGYGRFIIDSFAGSTKKGRLKINVKKYI